MTRCGKPLSAAPRPAIGVLLAIAILAGCAVDDGERVRQPSPEVTRALTARLLPPHTPDPGGWSADIQVAFSLLGLKPTAESLCSVIAVIAQESSFRTDPAVPGLGTIAWQQIDERAQRLGLPTVFVRTALRIGSPDGRSYHERIDSARTERELSEIYEDLIGTVPLGKRLFSGWNPVRTGGSMQVSVEFAESYVQRRPYPYADAGPIRREVFTRRGGLYFGIAHLLDYPAAYDRAIYRFADFNAGHYASRNAAFQNAVATASGASLAFDGDLIVEGSDPAFPGETERATRSLAERLGMDDRSIRRDLQLGGRQEFERTELYRQTFALADRFNGQPLPRALVPRIKLQGPKISRNLTTAWFAERVDGRRQQCLKRA